MKKAITVSVVALISTLVFGQSAKANSSCYMVDADGNTVSLGHLCGDTVQPPAPSSTETVSTDTMSEPSDATEAVDTPAEPVTLYTPELIAQWMDGCMYGATGGATDVSAEMTNVVRSYCQCTIDTLQNRHTSQEFAEILESTANGLMPPALQSVVDYCGRRTFG